MKRIPILLALLALTACAGGDGIASELYADGVAKPRVTIRGLLSMPDGGSPGLVDCDSKIPFAVGDMDPVHQRQLKKRVDELTRRDPGPITAELTGQVRKTPKGYRMESPIVVYVAPGECVDAEDLGLDY